MDKDSAGAQRARPVRGHAQRLHGRAQCGHGQRDPVGPGQRVALQPVGEPAAPGGQQVLDDDEQRHRVPAGDACGGTLARLAPAWATSERVSPGGGAASHGAGTAVLAARVG